MNAHVRPSDLIGPRHCGDGLEAVTADLARIRRQLVRLHSDAVQTRLDEAADGLSAKELTRQLNERRRALVSLASHLSAASAEGAMLQLLIVLCDELPALQDGLPDEMMRTQAYDRFQATRARIERLLYSAVWADDDVGDDLRQLRDDMAPRQYHAAAVGEELDARLAEAG